MQLTHPVATIMDTHLMRETRPSVLSLHDIVQELADIINLLTVHTNVIPLSQYMGMVLFYEGYATGQGPTT